ncbi:NUDIX hydrolase [Compostibacter hankyongensis]|uniref:NUDIX domain-containing protein n=1 Tax=Compostibacter hankyongensis TaxID=1007089 RepID=A0ABP8FTN3_9BACT
MSKSTIKNINTHAVELNAYFGVAISVDCVIFGFDKRELKVLLIRCDLPKYKGKWSLLGDLVGPEEDLDKAAYRVLKARTGLRNVYLQQVHTFGAPRRHPAGRVVSTAYYSLVNISNCKLTTQANELHWHPVKDIRTLAFDHKKIFDTCFEHLQEDIVRSPVVFKLLPQKFSLRQLQHVHEAILGVALDRRNFRKKIMSMELLEDLNEMENDVPHRPGRLYRLKPKAVAALS